MLDNFRRTVADSLRLVSAIGVAETLPPVRMAKKVAGALADRLYPAETLRDFGHRQSEAVDFGDKAAATLRGAVGLAAAVSVDAAVNAAQKVGAPALLDMEAGQLRAEIDAGGEYLLIDVREPAETSQGIIPGARLLPMSQVLEAVGSLRDSEKPIVIYCASGNRSRQVAQAMRDRGIVRTFNLKGGIQAWHAAGGEVESAGHA